MTNLNPDKISKTFRLKYKLDKDRVFTKNGQKIKSYVFGLGDDKKEKVASLWFSEGFNEVNVTITGKNEYRSTIHFANITKVVYIPKYRAIRFESHAKTYFSVLKVYWRGQFDFNVNWPEKIYKNTIRTKKGVT